MIEPTSCPSTTQSLYKIIDKQLQQCLSHYICQHLNISPSVILNQQPQMNIEAIIERQEHYQTTIKQLKYQHELQVSQLSEDLAISELTNKKKLQLSNQTITDLENQIDEKNQSIKRLTQKSQYLSSKLTYCQALLQKNQYSQSRLTQQLAQVKSFINAEMNQLIHLRYQSSSIQQRVAQEIQMVFCEQIINLKKQVNQKQLEIMQTISGLYQELEEDKAEDQQEQQVDKMNEEKSGEQKDSFPLKQLQQLLQLTKSKIHKVLKRNNELAAQKKQTAIKYDNFLKQTKATINAMKEKNKDLNAKVQQMKHEKQSSQAQRQLLCTNIHDLNHQLQEFQNLNSQTNKALDQKIKQIEHIRLKANQDIQQLKREVQDRQRVLKNKNIQIKAVQDSLEGLKAVIQDLKITNNQEYDHKECQTQIVETSNFTTTYGQIQLPLQYYTNKAKQTTDSPQINQKNSSERNSSNKAQLEFDSTIVEHMIEKTYQIRLQNQVMKDQLEILNHQLNEEKQKHRALQEQYTIDIERCQCRLKSIQVDNDELHQQMCRKKNHMNELIEKYSTLSLSLIQQEHQVCSLIENQATLYETLNRYAEQKRTSSQAILKLQNRAYQEVDKTQRKPILGKIVSLPKNTHKETSSALNEKNISQNSFLKNEQSTTPHKKYYESISNMNEIINYMINYLKGFTRNGIRNRCWAVSQGEEYVSKLKQGINFKQKYINCEKIRLLCLKDKECRHVIRDFEIIANFYFSELETLGNGQSEMIQTRCLNFNEKQRKNENRAIDINKSTPKRTKEYEKNPRTSANLRRNSAGLVMAGSISKNSMLRGEFELNKTQKLL